MLRLDILQTGVLEFNNEDGITDSRPTSSLLTFFPAPKAPPRRILIDLDHPNKPPEDIRNALAVHGLTPDAIDLVLFTHLHPDHFGHWKQFSNATFLFHETERLAFMFKGENRIRVSGNALFRLADNRLTPCGDVVPGIPNLKGSLYIRHTPGHTEGSLAFFAPVSEKTHAFCGDTFLDQTSFTNWTPPGMSRDASATLAQMAFIRDHADIIVPGHGAPFSTGKGSEQGPAVAVM